MGKGRILIVDDDALVLSSLETMLRSCGYETTTASSGSAAVEIMRKNPCEVVLMDVIMRDMDGIDTLRVIRGIAPGASVILISGYAEPERVFEALRTGAAAYIVKPFEEEEIVARIEDVLRRESAGG